MSSRGIIPYLTAILVCFVSICSAQSSFNPNTLDSIIQSEKNFAELKLAAKESSFTDNYDVVYMRAQWQIDPRVYYIKGDITYYIKPLSGNLQDVYFDLSNSMQFNSFIFQGSSSADFIREGNNTVKLHLTSEIITGTIDSITLSYEGAPVSTGNGSFTQSSHNFDSTVMHNRDSIIYTLSEPYGASDWFPCKNSLTDKMDSIDIIVQMPAEDRVGTNGIVVEDYLLNDSTHVMHWRSRYPIATYLVGIAVTTYSEIDEVAPLTSGDSVKVIEYVYKEDSAQYTANHGKIVLMLQLYSDFFGDYPFAKEKYGHAQWNWGGGMEHQTMSFVLFPNIFELIAHELGHQWFGDKITCASWQDIWLNEAFATYLAGLSYEHISPVYWLPYKITQLTRALRDSTGTVFCDDTTDISRIFSGALTYSKGMYVLHMLRWKLGDEIFFQSIRDYINDPALVYGFARTEDLKKHLEETSGENLDEFFNDWFYGKGYPSYHIKWANRSDGTVALTIHQTQNNPAVSFFEMPLPIVLRSEDGDSVIVRVENTFNDQTFIVGPFSFMPDTVKFDPELWIASTHNTVEKDELLSTPLIIFPNPAGNIIKISYHSENPVSEISIFDMSGKELTQLSAAASGFYEPLSLNISNFAAGCYLVEVKTTDGKLIGKFFKD